MLTFIFYINKHFYIKITKFLHKLKSCYISKGCQDNKLNEYFKDNSRFDISIMLISNDFIM
jgi:hypothetical protein